MSLKDGSRFSILSASLLGQCQVSLTRCNYLPGYIPSDLPDAYRWMSHLITEEEGDIKHFNLPDPLFRKGAWEPDLKFECPP